MIEDIKQAGPIFVLLVGLPGSGKSTFRSQFHGECVQLSTDDLIEDAASWQGKTYSEVFADEIKAATSAVNAVFREAIKDRASIIWDQTNLGVKKRKGILSQVPSDYHKVVVVVTCDEDLRQKRMAAREGKHIPAHIDESMRQNYQPPTLDEGWNEILYYKT